MNREIFEDITSKLKKELKKSRYDHVLSVAFTAASLAMHHDVGLTDLALTAGLMHDCAKCYSKEEMMDLCRKNHVEITEFDIKNPALLHAKLGPSIAEREYGISDPEVLSAVRYHTTGRPAMTVLEQIIFIADYIEPLRAPIPGIEEIREMAFRDLNLTVCMIAENTLDYLRTSGKSIDPLTEETRNYYKIYSEKL